MSIAVPDEERVISITGTCIVRTYRHSRICGPTRAFDAVDAEPTSGTFLDRLSAWPTPAENVRLLRALEQHLPFAIRALECSFKLILNEFAREGVKPYRRPKRPIFPDRAHDIWCVALEPRDARHHGTLDGECDHNRPASRSVGRCCRASPITIVWTGDTSLAQRR